MGSKRPRRVNTCLFCRSKKLKCDRKSPCSTCVKYKNVNCEYPNINIIRLEEDNEHLVRRLSLLKGQIKTLEKFIEQKDNAIEENSLDSLPFSVSETDISNSSTTVSGPISTTMSVSNSDNSSSGSSENVSDSLNESIDDCGGEEVPEEDYNMENICKIDSDKSCSDILSKVLPGTINLYHFYDPVLYEGKIRKYSPPMTWLSFFHCDKFMKITRKVTFNDLSLDNKLLFFNQLADAGCEHQLEKMFIIKYHDDEGYEDFKSLNDVFDDELSNNRKIISLNSISFQDSFTDKKLQNFEKFNLISKIHFILPKHEVIEILLNRFFKLIYPFIPIIDEDDFRSNIERILNSHKLKIKEKIDLSYIGILLIILRLSYLSIFSLLKDEYNELFETPDNIEIIKSNPINLDAIEVAQECSKYFNLLSYNDLRILQLGLFLRNYEIFGPEYGLGAKSNETYSFDIVLNRLANNLGLFNEFNFSNDNLKLANLKRKISIYIYSNNSIVSGVVSSNFISHSINIKIPAYNTENSNNRSPEIENVTIKLLNICLGGKRIVKTCNEFFEKFNFNDTNNKKNQFNHLINTILTDDMKSQNGARYKAISNTFILQFKITVQVLNLSVLFHVFNGIQDPSIRITFLDRLIYYIFKKTIPIITIIFKKKNELTNVNDLIFIPNLLHLLHRIFIILLSLMIRLKLLNIKLVKENNMNQLYRLNLQLIDLINSSFTKLLKVIHNLSHRYYYAWRTFKIQNYFLRCINLLDLPSIFECELQNDDNYFGVSEQLLESWICMVVNFTKDQ
ncbi:hypothetical protein CLIB1444_01S13520 [[Candida] jaroonii]|uniref:Uncharacterized protein n=1 Tax=[Candida] jaroonii TaxID=467808 RepID=A0ACA9Y1B1_9ASCO|nr:hypothetical protein CLIB1444_01S13520 [[Candida] jaroonii]